MIKFGTSVLQWKILRSYKYFLIRVNVIFKSSRFEFLNLTPSYPFSPPGKYPAAVSVPQKIYKNRKFEQTGNEINDEKPCSMDVNRWLDGQKCSLQVTRRGACKRRYFTGKSHIDAIGSSNTVQLNAFLMQWRYESQTRF